VKTVSFIIDINLVNEFCLKTTILRDIIVRKWLVGQTEEGSAI